MKTHPSTFAGSSVTLNHAVATERELCSRCGLYRNALRNSLPSEGKATLNGPYNCLNAGGTRSRIERCTAGGRSELRIGVRCSLLQAPRLAWRSPASSNSDTIELMIGWWWPQHIATLSPKIQNMYVSLPLSVDEMG